MDSIAQIKPQKDTTLGLLEAAQRKGWSLFYFEQDDLYLRDNIVYGEGQQLCVSLNNHDWFQLETTLDMALTELDVILMRKDPPINLEFLYTCHLLEHMTQVDTLVVNNPQAIRLVNEKIFTQQFADLSPPTLVSRNHHHITRFLNEYHDVVIKPLDNMGGASVFRLQRSDQNTDVIIEAVTHNGQRTTMVQKLISGYEKGDKRILVIDGEPVPFALTRIPPRGKLRANLAAGGHGEISKLNDRDREICARLAPILSDMGLIFVGLDVIGGYLTEVNITSPTCMREINTACNLDIGMQVMDAISNRFALLGKQ